jgi:sortase (surface protein transpeptidase)
MTRLTRSGGIATIALIAAVSTACGGSTRQDTTAVTAPTSASKHATSTSDGNAASHKQPFVPAALTAKKLGLRAGPVNVPLLLEIPKLDINAAVLGVGIDTKTNAMDAPEGPHADPVWQQAFWYRGSAIPGAKSTALIAGHIDGGSDGSAVFSHLGDLRAGDSIVVHDTRNGREVHFAVTATKSYTLAEAAQPAVLKHIYGVGPVVGKWAQPSADGLAHLTLITCAGTFRDGTHDHRLVVYANRIP